MGQSISIGRGQIRRWCAVFSHQFVEKLFPWDGKACCPFSDFQFKMSARHDLPLLSLFKFDHLTESLAASPSIMR